MSGAHNSDSPRAVDELFKRLTRPETDVVTHGELWDVYSMAEIRRRRDQSKKDMEDKSRELRDAIAGGTSAKANLQEGSKRLDPGLSETAAVTSSDNHIQVSRALRHYKEAQSESITLENYYQRRYIRERMEGIFHRTGYMLVERLILLLILVVLGMLVIEFTFGEFLTEADKAQINACYQGARKASGNGAQVKRKADDCIIEEQFGLVSGSKAAAEITVYGDIENSFLIVKTDDRIISMLYFALIDLVACFIFLAEYFLRLYLSDDRLWYIRNHKIDFISSIPLTAILVLVGPGVAKFVPLHGLRILRFLRIFRAMRIATFIWRGMERLEQVAMIRMMKKSFYFLVSLALIGAVLFKYIESHEINLASPGAATVQPVAQTEQAGAADELKYVTEIEHSVWWSLTTLTTGGFGDLYSPRTPAGWFLTLFLIISGIIVVGIFTASLTSIFLGQDATEIERSQDAMQEQMTVVTGMIEKLEGELIQLKTTGLKMK